jgi:hypothetical protein
MSTLKRKSIELITEMYLERMKALYTSDLKLLDANINIPSLDVGGLKVIRDVHSEHAEVLEYILETLK